MVPSGLAEIVELIWHFTGYLRLDPDGVARVSINYNGALVQAPQDETPPDITLQPFKPLPQDLDSDPSPSVTLPDADELQWTLLRWHPQQDHFHPEHIATAHPLPLQNLTLPHAGGDVVGDGGFGLITIEPMINQEIIDLRQVNIIYNNDEASVGSTILPLEPLDTASTLVSMLLDAQNAVPGEFIPDEVNSTSVLQFVAARDSDPVQTQANEAPYAVTSGKYINGELQDLDTDVHQLTNDMLDTASAGLDTGRIEPIPSGDYSDTAIQNLSLGGNTAVNDATIFSDSGLCGSMLILGNSYQTQAIFQTNVLTQSDHFQITPGGDAGISFVSNVVQNIADISEDGGLEGPWIVGGPLNWSVDVLHGSLYDVKCMLQTNYISDNDVVSQTQSFGYSLVLAGSNEQVNAVDFQSPMGQWDLIVIEGSYHRLNVIDQKNVVLDMNHASQDWVGSGGGDPGAQGIIAGNNALLNDATIVYFGATGSLGTTDSMLDLANVLASGETPDSSLIATAFPNLMGTIHVLYVQGDYYDLSYLSQTNVISDVDVAAQLLTTEGNGQQSMTTGSNSAINSAAILDTGSLTTPYVQGDSYSDTILIQTNIITTDPNITTNDPAKLVPELVAFTGSDAPDHAVDAPQLFAPVADNQHNGDILAGTLH
ncbi:MAG TPA: hypothetical protein VFP60_10145 [Pseudolabrys sp.]|nr:hypothetical protein [Pseudolabrys sp.]